MGGKHALVPDNRTFYFNYIENNFYPIYYDGDMNATLHKNYKTVIFAISTFLWQSKSPSLLVQIYVGHKE